MFFQVNQIFLFERLHKNEIGIKKYLSPKYKYKEIKRNALQNINWKVLVRIWKEGFLNKLPAYGISTKLCHLIASFLPKSCINSCYRLTVYYHTQINYSLADDEILLAVFQ